MDQGMSGRRVAFFGGSFDPPHLGHLAVARAARAGLELDTVLFAPVGAQPLKPVGATAPFADRVAMTRLAIAGERGFEISLVDAPKNGGAPNYTVDTLKAMKAELGAGSELFCLMGADSFAGLRLWHRAAEIPFVAALIVASRPGDDLGGLKAHLPGGLLIEEDGKRCGSPGRGVEVFCYSIFAESGRRTGERTALYVLPEVDVPISATKIREMAHEGAGGGHDMLPAAVAEYVRAHRLYR
jgi:nicotinate-nucleotide adenylyltransferase